MATRNLTILCCVLDAAKALSVVAYHGNDFLKKHALQGLHDALIAAEEVRQEMIMQLAKVPHENEGEVVNRQT